MIYHNLNNNSKKAQIKKTAFSLIELSVVVLIIGILIAGITAGSRLVRNSKLASAAQFTKSSDINSIPDLVLWLEPTQENSFATTSTNSGNLTYANVASLQDANYIKDTLRPDNREYVARWNDINPRAVPGNKKSVYQEVAAQRPMYIANAINGLPALQFDGSTQYLYSQNNATTPSAPPFNAGDKSITYVAVFNYYDPTQSTHTPIVDQYVGFTNSTIGLAELGMGYGGQNPRSLSLLTWNSNWNSSGQEGLGTILGRNNYIGIISLEETSILPTNNLIYCLNSSSCSKKTHNTNSSSLNDFIVSDNEFALAARSCSGCSGQRLNGLIGEVMVFDRALKNEEIDIINKYLSKKWGIALK